ncbi:MAG: PAS domain S-box protein [Mongoliibacter sp.]|uniref:PAS domain-containing protein n=1 Tax=Mongoliibacter sp. TaxID=2022438 RepID=UPI0012EF66EB|nr:PAS domain-containing protein [Mongoliibacter sp.]TVP48547.1 MAG: PAS domain S-box protein [Mongoliibacter sp.]
MTTKNAFFFQNILLTLKRYKEGKYELLYISSEIKKILEEGDKFYEESFFQALFPTLPMEIFENFYKRLGNGDKIYCPILTNKSTFQFVEIEGYVIAQEDQSYLVNALISPSEWKNSIKYSWLIQKKNQEVIPGDLNDHQLKTVEEWVLFVYQTFDFIPKSAIKKFIKNSDTPFLEIFPRHLYLTRQILGGNVELIQLEFFKSFNANRPSSPNPKKKEKGLLYYDYNPTTDKVNWTGKTEEILGYPNSFFEDFTGEDWKKLIHPDDRHSYKVNYAENSKLNYRVLHKGGHYVFVQDEVRRFENGKGSEELILGIITDITALKDIEKDLMKNKSVLDELTGVVPGMVYLLQAFPNYTHKFLFVSDGSKSLMGLKPEDILEDEDLIDRLIHPEDKDLVYQADRNAYLNDTKFEAYFRIILPDGETKWIYGTSDRLRKYKSDSIWAGFFVDFTYTRQKEKESSVHLNRYKTLFEENPLPTLQYDQKGNILDANKSFVEKIDLQNSSILLGKNIFELVGDNPIKNAYQKSISEGYGFYEGPYISAFNQKLFHLRVNAKEIEKGKYYQAILEDISEQEFVSNTVSQLTENTSKYSGQEYFEQLTLLLSEKLDMNHCFIAEIKDNGQEAEVLSYTRNGKKEKNFNYNLENTPCKECLNRNEPLIIQKDAFKDFNEDLMLLEMNISTYLGVPIIDLSGNRLGILVIMDEKPKPYSQRLAGLLSILSDRIGAELKRLNYEHKLIVSEQLFRSIAENFPKGTIEVLDKNLIYIHTDGKEYHNKGIDPKKLIGTPHLAKYESYIVNEVRLQLDKVLQGESVMFEVVIDNQYYLKSAVPLKNNSGEIDRILLFTQNITETKHAEEEREQLIRDLKSQNEELQRFAYIISHNLRAPIVNISSLLDLYDATSPANPDNEEVIQNLKISTNILHSTLQDLIEVVSIKKNKLPKIENIAFGKILRNVEKSLAKQISEANAFIIKDFSEVKKINYIYSHLENFLINLTTNSLKYKHPDRDPEIRIKTWKENEFTVLQYSDNGIGIDLERYGDRLFGLYQRFHSHVEGKGLGLYLVREQIRAHDGNLTIESEVGKGTTFKIFLRNLKIPTFEVLNENN